MFWGGQDKPAFSLSPSLAQAPFSSTFQALIAFSSIKYSPFPFSLAFLSSPSLSIYLHAQVSRFPTPSLFPASPPSLSLSRPPFYILPLSFFLTTHTQEQVQKILAGIMNGTIVLTAVNKDGSSMPVKDSICRAETKLSFAPPPIDTLDDKGNVEAGPKPLSALYIALIAVASVSVLFAAIFLIRRRNTPKARSAVVAATSS